MTENEEGTKSVAHAPVVRPSSKVLNPPEHVTDSQRMGVPAKGLDFTVAVEMATEENAAHRKWVEGSTAMAATSESTPDQSRPEPKRVRFIRHGHCTHNATFDFNNPKQTDARLTARGQAQCAKLRTALASENELEKPQLLIASSLSRAMDTASIVYNLDENVGNPPARRIVTELCREEISTHYCDRRRTLTELKKDFQSVHFDFSSVDEEEDSLWQSNKQGTHDSKRKVRVFGTLHGGPKVWRTFIENPQILEGRIQRFVEFLLEQPEDEIVVVSHAVFLAALGRYLVPKLHSTSIADSFFLTSGWRNCETRVFVFYPMGSRGLEAL